MDKSLQTIYTQVKEISLSDPSVNSNILVQIVKENQMHIILNRPKFMNAFSFDMYFTFREYIDKANQLQEIKYIVVRGNGGHFTSGNDLNNFTRPQAQQFENKRLYSKVTAKVLSDFTVSILRSKKPIFGLVDGRTIGFGFTQIALYDKVFATERSTFMAPLVKIAQGPEMCSSYLFPKIFGQALAEEIIIKGKWMTPKQLQSYGLLTCYKDNQSASEALQAHIDELEELDWASYIEARKLMRNGDMNQLFKANELECENLVDRWSNEDLPAFLMRYMANRKKQKPKL